jgi:hypothetical protein
MQHLHTSSELKQVVTDTHITNAYVIMNEEKDELAERYFAIIEEMVKDKS